MLKKLSIVISLVLTLVIGGAAYVAHNANRLVVSYKPQLESIASKALGAAVTFGELDVSILPATKIGITNTVIGRSTTSPGLELNNLDLSVGLTGLLRGHLDIKALILHSPRVTVVKQGGVISVEGLPAKPSAPAATPSPTTEASAQSSAGAPLSIALEKFLLDDGSITFKDLDSNSTRKFEKISIESTVRMGATAVELPSLALSGSLNGSAPLSLRFQDLYFGTASGELTASKLTVSLLKNVIDLVPEIQIKGPAGKVAVSSPGLDLAALRPILRELSPSIEGLKLTGTVTPNIVASFDQGQRAPTYSAKGSVTITDVGLDSGTLAIRGLKGTMQLSSTPTQLALSSSKITGAVNGEPLEIALSASMLQQSHQARLDSFTLLGFGGSTKANLTAALTAPQAISFEVDSQNLEIAKLMQLSPGGNTLGLTGKLPLIRAKLNGIQGAALANSLQGTASVSLKDGALSGTNIVGTVLKQIASLPMVSPGVLEGLDPKTKAAIESKDTVIGSLSGDFAISGGTASTSNLNLVGPFFSLSGTGSTRFDGSVDLAATIALTPDLSAAIVRSAKGLSKALDGNQQLVLPLKIIGKAPALKVVPNTEKLLGMAAEKAIEQGLKGLLKGSGEGKKNPLGTLFGGVKK